MKEQLQESEFVVFDTETTGLDYVRCDEIIEIAAQRVTADAVKNTFYSLLNPVCDITPEAYSVHGLSKVYLAEHGKPAQEVLPKFVDFCQGAVLVGHNILQFDLHFVNRQLREHGHDSLRNTVIDTLIMARKLLPRLPNHKLTTLATYFTIDAQGAHRAERDVEMNKLVFLELLKLYFQQDEQKGAIKTLL